MSGERGTEMPLQNSNQLIINHNTRNLTSEHKKSAIAENITRQILKVTQIQHVKSLSLCKNELCYLPMNFFSCLTNLIQLDLSDNNLNDLPDSLRQLKQLQDFSISCNRFSHIPKVVCELNSLRSLNAHKNRIQELPNNIQHLSNLENLDLSSNALKNLPISGRNLNHLRILSLADNKFSEIPGCIVSGMNSLEILNVSQNYRINISVPPKSENLKEFYAENNYVCLSFPKWVFDSKFHNLEIVSLNETNFRTFDVSNKSSHSHVKRLSLSQCRLSDVILNRIIAKITNLEEVITENSQSENNQEDIYSLESIQISETSSLKQIQKGGVEITKTLKSFNDFSTLSIIDVSGNSISWIPDEICLLTNLKCLDIHNNNLGTLPKNIGNLVSLKELKACYNLLYELPDSMKDLQNIEFLDFYDNEFSSVPEVIVEMKNLLGLDLEQNYFSTDNLWIDRDTQYKAMRNVLTTHWPEYGRRFMGPKVDSYSEIEEKISLSSDSRRSSLLEYNCALPDQMGSFTDLTEEKWDGSEDSTDEFDPNVCKEPTRQTRRTKSPLIYYQQQHSVFCPADAHEKKVHTQILEMLQNGMLIWSTSREEGQFEDP